MSYCPRCGSGVSQQDNFCSNCGNLLHSSKEKRSKYAGFWLRLVAAFIDGIIVSGAWTIVAKLIGISPPIDPMTMYEYGDEPGMGFSIWHLINIMMAWLYYASFESSKLQATPGKMALGIAVTDYDGEMISFGKATARYFSKTISAFILLIGYIMAAFTERKQALHDLIAGTLVVRRQDGD